MNGSELQGTETIAGSAGIVMQFLGTAIFRWLPGSVATVFNAGQPGSVIPAVSPVTEPVSFGTMIRHLASTSDAATQFPLYQYWIDFVLISAVVSLVLVSIVIYSNLRVQQIRRYEEEVFAASAATVAAGDVPRTQLRWKRIMEQIHSDNEQNWRLAILECDIMLNELLDVQGYRGETMGEKMKSVERGDFQTIDMAWEAHRMRNKIAHEGASLVLTQREARRIIAMYERVFREFRFVE